MSELVGILGKVIPKLEEPKKYAIQLQIRGPIPICLTAAQFANEALKTVARYPGDQLPNIVEAWFDKSDWLDITAELPKDIAEVKLQEAELASEAGKFFCGCGKNFNLRLGKAD
jgi:hypothetical protein